MKAGEVEADLARLLARAAPGTIGKRDVHALRHWLRWHLQRYAMAMPLPLEAAVVVRFIREHAPVHAPADRPHDASAPSPAQHVARSAAALGTETIKRRLAALSKLHSGCGLASPTANPEVRRILESARRNERRAALRAADAPAPARLSLRDVSSVVHERDVSMAALRDRALLLVWAVAASRLADVTRLEVTDVRARRAAWSGREGAKAAFDAARRWIDAIGITDGPVFRRIRPGPKAGAALNPAGVARVIRARLMMAGLECPRLLPQATAQAARAPEDAAAPREHRHPGT